MDTSDSFDNNLDDLLAIRHQIRRLENRRLSQRVEETLLASPNLRQTRTPCTSPEGQEDFNLGTEDPMVRKSGSKRRGED